MSKTDRRAFLARAAVAAACVDTAAAEDRGAGLAFGNRAHIRVRPEVKQKLAWCFSAVLGCGEPISLKAPNLAEPMLAFRFAGGGSLSVEFTEDAPDEQQAPRGAWLEIWSNDVAAVKRKVLDAGFAQVRHPATNTFYFAAPGGQVFGIVAGSNPSAGEIRGK